ncbi:MAG: hypothetical protein RL101_66 [Actinomycetota bacterium]|jgi:predicted NBD/HSP70 family sugar kinase
MVRLGKSQDAIRRENLSALLREVHIEGAVSRATLGLKLGLSKTTIAELVTELEQVDLVRRVGNEHKAAAGRPSQLVSPSKTPLALVVNPEIDGVNIALVNFAAELSELAFYEFDGPYSPNSLISIIQGYIRQHKQILSGRLQGVVLALPGAIDRTTGRLIDAPSLGWRDIDVASEVQSALGVRVWCTNNARAATVSEHYFGAAKGLRDAVCLFSGVGGIGGGLIVNSCVLEGSHGLAGEIGKMQLLVESNRKGQTFGEIMRREDLVNVLGKSRLSDVDLDEELSRTTDIDVNKVVDTQVAILISAIETLRDLFDPEAVILGGYLGSLVKSRSGQMISALNRNSLKSRGPEFLVPRVAELKAMVLLGAAECAWNEILQDPIPHTRKSKNAH